MPSTLPIVLFALTLTGLVTAVWKLAGTLMARRVRSAGPTDDPLGRRLEALGELLWSVVLLVHFVFLEVLSESREVPEALGLAANVSGALCLIGALLSLAACISLERGLLSRRP